MSYRHNFLVYIENGISRKAILMRNTTYLHVKENSEDIPILPPDLVL